MERLSLHYIFAQFFIDMTSAQSAISMNLTSLSYKIFNTKSLMQRLRNGQKSEQTNCGCISIVCPRSLPSLTVDHPSYYHLHIHIVHTDYQGSDGMAVGKAWLLDDVIEQLTLLGPEGFKRKTITVIVGEESDLWKKVYSKLS
jgi:hypothetical protein